jgi:hypothetical protein
LLHPVSDASDRKRLSRTANDIVRETQQARKSAGFPENGIATAENVFSDLLVLLPISEHILVWDHETGELSDALVRLVLTVSSSSKADLMA